MPCDTTAVYREPGTATATGAAQGFGNHEIERDSAGPPPHPRIDSRDESSFSQRILQQRFVSEPIGGQDDVGVGGGRSHREVTVAGVQVDSLSTHEDNRIAVWSQGIQGVQQNAPGQHVLNRATRVHRVHAGSLRASTSRSCSASSADLPGPLSKSTTA